MIPRAGGSPRPDVSAEKNVNMKTAASVDSSSACRTKKAQSLIQQPNPSLFDLKHSTRFEFYVQTFQSDSPKHILDKCSFTNQVKSTKGTVLASGQDIDGIMYVFRFERISRQMFSTCAFVP